MYGPVMLPYMNDFLDHGCFCSILPDRVSRHSLSHKKNQSVAPDRPSMPPPIKKEMWVAGKQEGQAGSLSYRQLG
jgi:hypothetical protein